MNALEDTPTKTIHKNNESLERELEAIAINPYPFKACFKTGAILTGMAQVVGLVFSTGITYAMMASQAEVFASGGLLKQILFFAWMSFSFLGLFAQWFYVVPLLLIAVIAWPFVKYKSFGGFLAGILAVSGGIFTFCLAISLISIWLGLPSK